MNGSLHLPLRGASQQIIYAHQSLYVLARHDEGQSLGLYLFPLHAWAKGELSDDQLEPFSGLRQIGTEQSFVWLAYSKHDQRVYCVNNEGMLFTIDEDASFKAWGSLHLACAADQTHFLLDDTLYALGKNAQEWELNAYRLGDSTIEQAQLWSGSLSGQNSKKVDDEATEINIHSAQVGPNVLGFGLSDGRVALWYASTRGDSQWTPLFAQTHDSAITALGFVHAEDKDYLLSYSKDLTLAQTRLDDLEPMPRAAKAKGLHSTAPFALVTAEYDRFYTVAQDGVRAWRDSFSNYRPASHEGLSTQFDNELIGAFTLEFPVKNVDNKWETQACFALFSASQIALYPILNPDQEAAIVSGEEDQNQRGRLDEKALWQASGEQAWTKARLASDDETIRTATVEQLVQWNDYQSLSALEKVAAKDESTSLRKVALKAIIASSHPAVIHALTRLLSAEHKATSIDAFKALRKAYGKDSLYPMKKALELGQEAVGESAIQALGDLAEAGSEASKSMLKSELDHQHVVLAESARTQLERCYAVPQAYLIGLNSKHIDVQTMALHRLWEEGLCAEPTVSGRLQQLRDHHSEALRRYALAVTLLSHSSLAEQLRSQDALLHEELNKVAARRLTGEARAQVLAQEQSTGTQVELDAQARLLLFEISACGQEDIAVYGPVALALTGDLRALPTLLALSRAHSLFVRLRATQGLAALALKGEHRAQAQLERLVSDQESSVRLEAYRGLSSLYQHALDYAQLGLSAEYADVRLAGLSALQESEVYQAGMRLNHADSPRVREVLASALCRHDDLGLAQEARKLYLRDLIGGSYEAALSLCLESSHDELRRLILSDISGVFKGGSSGKASGKTGSTSSGAGLAGQSFLFTGTLTTMKRADAQRMVTDLGGVAASSVTNSLSYLVIGDAGKAGSKLSKAQSLGVPVISETEFMQVIEHAQGGGQESSIELEVELDDDEKQEVQKQLIQQVLNDPLSSIRLEACKQLIAEKEADAVLKAEIRLVALDLALEAQFTNVKCFAIKALGQVQEVEVGLSRLQAHIGSKQTQVAQLALETALKLADEQLESLVEAGLAFEDETLRGLVVKAAADAPKKLSWREDVLLRAISDGVASIREEAFRALRADEQVSVAAQLLDHAQADIRDRAALTLAKVGDERALVIALEALQTPAPKAEEVIAAQEAMGGEFGLLDDVQWKRQVTLALSAQQRAFAAASAQAFAQVNSEDAGAQAEAGATGVAYAEQSLQALVSVNDQLEGAVARATSTWRTRINSALTMISEGRFQGAFDTVWALITQYQLDREASDIDAHLAKQLYACLKFCAPQSACDLLAAQLKYDDEAQSLAWALCYLGDLRGFTTLMSSSLSAQERFKAALSFDGVQAQRTLAQLMNQGGVVGQLVLYAEILKLMTFGQEAPMLIAGLSSDEVSLRRSCAQWITHACDVDRLKQTWLQEMEERRDRRDLEWEEAMLKFEAGTLKQKPKGSKPSWPNEQDWYHLALCLSHPLAQTRAYAVQALLDLPRSSAEAKAWTLELNRQTELASVCAKSLGQIVTNPPQVIKASLSQNEAESLAFGAYASLISSERDVQSLQALADLFSSDPLGARAILQMSLRRDDALQKEAFKVLEAQSNALGLSAIDRAGLLISTAQASCVEQGAQLLAQTDRTQSEALVLSDDGIGSQTALYTLLELDPESGFNLFELGFKSANEALRKRMIRLWVELLKVWPSEKKPLETDDEEIAKKRSLNHLAVKLLKALSHDMTKELALERLLSVLNNSSSSQSLQLDLIETLLDQKVMNQSERKQLVKPLKNLLSSSEPEVYRRALNGLKELKAPGAAQTLLDRLLDDPTQSADESATWRALAELRDASVVNRLLELMADSRWSRDELISCVLQISGYDEAISEYDIWEEMDEDDRKAETKRAYQTDTLALLISRCAQLGESDAILYEFSEAAQTARGDEVNVALEGLCRLPLGSGDELRSYALDTLLWRVQHRHYQPDALVELVKHRDIETRRKAAMVLAYAKRGEGVTLLMGIARDRAEGYYQRQEAIRALGASADLRSVSVLIQIFDDEQDYFRSEALEALGSMSASEVADEILKRLITGLNDYSFVNEAINGLQKFNTLAGWHALRRMISSGSMSSYHSEMITALTDDSSAETQTLLRKVIREGDLYGSSLRLEAYQAWKSQLTRGIEDENQRKLAQLEPARDLFFTDLYYYSDWENALELILEIGEPSLWVELTLAGARLGGKHNEALSRFEAKLRELNPPPLDQLLPHLSKAIENAPALAKMTLSLLGNHQAALSEQDHSMLLTATESLRLRWLEQLSEKQMGARNSIDEDLSHVYGQLLWLWGQLPAGQTPLMSALQSKGLNSSLYERALFALEGMSQKTALKFDESFLSIPAASHPRLSAIVTRLAMNAGLSAVLMSDDHQEAQGTMSLSSWTVMSQTQAEQQATSKVHISLAAKRGEASALTVLIAQKDISAMVELLDQLSQNQLKSLSPEAQLNLVRASANFGASELEEALVRVAKNVSDENLQREAWRTRRRVQRKRQKEEAQRV